MYAYVRLSMIERKNCIKKFKALKVAKIIEIQDID